MKNDKTKSTEELEEQSANTNSHSKDKKNKSKLKRNLIAMSAAILFFSAGGPIGITLGVFLILFIAKKPLLKYLKKGFESINEKWKKHNIKKNELKLKQKTLENNHRVSETSTLEMDKESLRKMGTRDDKVSKIDVLPDDKAKTTSNGFQPKPETFSKFTKPSIKLNEQALKRRQQPTLSRRNSMPSRTVRPVLK